MCLPCRSVVWYLMSCGMYCSSVSSGMYCNVISGMYCGVVCTVVCSNIGPSFCQVSDSTIRLPNGYSLTTYQYLYFNPGYLFFGNKQLFQCVTAVDITDVPVCISKFEESFIILLVH